MNEAEARKGLIEIPGEPFRAILRVRKTHPHLGIFADKEVRLTAFVSNTDDPKDIVFCFYPESAGPAVQRFARSKFLEVLS